MQLMTRTVEHTKGVQNRCKSQIGSRVVAGLAVGLALTACAPMTTQQEAQVASSINTVMDGHYRNGYYTKDIPVLVAPVPTNNSSGGKSK